MDDDLEKLLTKALKADRSDRIGYRDSIAAYSELAIKPIATWLVDPELGAFAVRVLGRIADLGCLSEAARVLRAALANSPPEQVRRDIELELARLAPKLPRARSAPRGRPASSNPAASLDDLVVGRVYSRRRDLHSQGLGGNWQKGISYPAQGSYVLLFSDPAKATEHGYRDTWQGGDAYRYFGEWDGTGDMRMTGGNAAIRDRSPDLYLFVAATGGYRYEGRFRFDGYDVEPTVRDGRQFTAIVFRLSRAR